MKDKQLSTFIPILHEYLSDVYKNVTGWELLWEQ